MTDKQMQEPLTDSFVQLVPDKCDRIVWRGSYHHLPPAAQRQWVGLTEDEQDELVYSVYDLRTRMELAIGIEAKLKEKNT
jgi:hypothetical protein